MACRLARASPSPCTALFERTDRKILREGHYYDAYSFLIQLGVLPAPELPEATPAS